MTEKEILRKKLIEKRKLLKSTEKDISVTKNLLEFLKSRNILSVLCFVSLPDEIDTKYILNNKSLKIAVPKVFGDYMEFFEFLSFENLEKGAFGVNEPKKLFKINKNDYDCCITPGLAFSYDGKRIGYGKGYYDKYLKDYNNIKIGICYSEMLCDEIPVDKNDVFMDVIITEKDVIILGKEI